MPTQHRWRVFAATALTAALALGGAVTAATAAPPHATEATLTSISFVEEAVASGSSAEIRGSWALPDDPTTPAGFVVDLPAGLQGLTDDFALLDPDGVAMGQCVVTATQIVCDFDDDYLASHPRNLAGTFFFWATVTTEVTEATEVTYDFGDAEGTVTVTPSGGPCTDCEFSGVWPSKWGWYDRESDRIEWHVDVQAPVDGMAGGETVTVRDRLGPNQEFLLVDGEPSVMVGGTNERGADGFPTGWRDVSAEVGAQVRVVDGELEVTFTSEQGYYYAVVIVTQVTDGGAAGTYGNDADIVVEGQATVPVVGQVVRQGGGGTGAGDDVGRFSITKGVDWSDEPVAGLTFSGTYTATAPDGDVTTGAFSVAEDGTWTSPELEAGTIVHIEETLPTEPANLDWAAPALSHQDFAITGGTTVAVQLTNAATVALGQFSAAKVIEGDGAALVADDAVFELAYSYPAGPGFAAGSGVLELPADGTEVRSPQLPVGAIVTLEEVAPAAIDGATWADPELSTTTVTIGRDAVVEVTVTNTLTLAPTTPPATAAPTAGGSSLPRTGVDLAGYALGVGGLLIAAGALARLRTMRRAAEVD